MGIVISKGALDPGDPRLHRTSIVVGTGLLSFAGKTQQASAEDAAKGEPVKTQKAKEMPSITALDADDPSESAAPSAMTTSGKTKPKTSRPQSKSASGTSTTGSTRS